MRLHNPSRTPTSQRLLAPFHHPLPLKGSAPALAQIASVRPGILLPDDCQHLPPGIILWLRPIRASCPALRCWSPFGPPSSRYSLSRVSSPVGKLTSPHLAASPAHRLLFTRLRHTSARRSFPRTQSLSSSTGPPQEVASVGDILWGCRGHYQRGSRKISAEYMCFFLSSNLQPLTFMSPSPPTSLFLQKPCSRHPTEGRQLIVLGLAPARPLIATLFSGAASKNFLFYVPASLLMAAVGGASYSLEASASHFHSVTFPSNTVTPAALQITVHKSHTGDNPSLQLEPRWGSWYVRNTVPTHSSSRRVLPITVTFTPIKAGPVPSQHFLSTSYHPRIEHLPTRQGP